MMVGSYFFMRYRTDWAYTSVYDMFRKRALKRSAKKQNFDLEKAPALRKYVQDMESQLQVLGMTSLK
jgi:hypothetical protein